MAIKTSVVSKDEFVEIRVEVFAAQAMICAKGPSLKQRESPMDPRQNDVASHGADNARIVLVARQLRV